MERKMKTVEFGSEPHRPPYFLKGIANRNRIK